MAGQRITAAEVGLADTIGILRQPWIRPRRTSAGHGWSGLYLSTQCEQPYHASFEPARTHLVVLHLDGPVKLEYGSGGWIERKSVPAGGFVLHPAGRDLDIALGGDLNTIHAYLAAEQVDEVAEGRPVKLVAGFGPSDPMIEQLLLAMDGVLKEQGPTARTYIDHLTAMLAAHLVYRYGAARGGIARMLGTAGLDQPQLDDVVDVMKLRLAEPIPLGDLAAVAGLSTSQLIRRFKTSTGLAPHRYLVRLRLAHAVRQLRTGDRPIADIALSCGFSHQEHLTRVMRRQMGTTPAAVRRSG